MKADQSTPTMAVPASVVPYILVLFCGLIWGMTFSLARIATLGSAHPLGLAFWQALGGGSVLAIFCLLRWRRPQITRTNFKHACVIALFGTAIPGTLYFYAAPKVPAGVLAITVALVPMLTYAISWLLGIEQFGRRRLCGIILGLVAIILLVAPDTSLPEPGMTRWLIPPLIASVFYTLENIYVDMRVGQHPDMIGLLTIALMLAALVLAPIIYFEGAFYPINWPLDRTEIALIAMMLVSSIAYVLFLYAVKLAGAVFASMAGYIITLSGVFWGMMFFAERHSPWVWTALVLMLLGMVLVTPRRRAPDLGAHV